jgi:putative ABC transport system permease protein
MLYKLAAKSFFRQSRGYLVYFFCMTLSVMIYYSFNAMTYDQSLIRLAAQSLAIDNVLGFGNFLIISLLIFFMFSANRFFLNKRIKEFGIYQLFGVKKIQVALIYCMGIAAISFISTCLGILLGIIFSKLFAMILVKMMHLQVSTPFFVSIPSIYGTITLFFIIVAMVALHSLWKIWLLPMFPSFEVMKKPYNKMRTLKKWHYFLGVAGIVLILYGYGSALRFREVMTKIFMEELNPSMIVLYPLMIFFCCVLGTYFFFSYTTKLISYKVSKQKSSYKGLRFLIAGNTRIHLLKGRRTNTLITIILGISLAMIGGVASLSTFSVQQREFFNPVSYQMTPTAAKKAETILDGTKESKKVLVMNYKMSGSLTNFDFANVNTNDFRLVSLVSEEEYQRYRKLVPSAPDIQLKGPDKTILMDELQTTLRNFSSYGSTIYLPNQKTLQVQEFLPDYLGESSLRYNSPALIVSNDLYRSIEGAEYQVVYWDMSEEGEQSLSQVLNRQMEVSWSDPIYYQYDIHKNKLDGSISKTESKTERHGEGNGDISRLNFTSRYDNLREIHLATGIYLYVALFVGMIVVVTTGSILMVRQLAEAEEEKETYALLTKLGIGRKEINQMIFKQNAVLFFPPMILGILHAIFAINVYTQYIQAADYWLAYLVCGLLIVIYMLLYYATSKVYCRIVEN